MVSLYANTKVTQLHGEQDNRFPLVQSLRLRI